MRAKKSKIFHNFEITLAQERRILNETVKYAAVAVHEYSTKFVSTFQHAGFLIITGSDEAFLVHNCPDVGTIIDIFTPDLERKYVITKFHKPLKEETKVLDFYCSSSCGKPGTPGKSFGWGPENAGVCSDSVWRMLEELFDSRERSKLRFEWMNCSYGNALTFLCIDISYFWITSIYFGNGKRTN